MPGEFLDLRIDGMDALLGGLKSAQQGLAKEQRRANKDVAGQVASWASRAAASGTRQQAASADAIRAQATSTIARLSINQSSRFPFANAAFWGMQRRTGWYAAARYAGSTGRQAPKWVGANWIAGRAGEGPYVINPTIAAHIDEIEALYAHAYERALAAAFPKGFE